MPMNSNEFVQIIIYSLFSPRTNEVWIKHSQDLDGDFTLVSPMQYGVNYQIKHSGNFLYKKDETKITKIPLPSKFLSLTEPSAEKSNIKERSDQLAPIVRDKLALTKHRSIELPTSHYFERRDDAITIRDDTSMALLEPAELVKTDYDAKLLDYAVYQHYLCLLEERNMVEQLKVLNLTNGRWKTYTQPEEFYSLKFEDNMAFNTQYIRYRMSTPHWPDRVNELNMGMARNKVIQNDHYANYDPENYKTERIVAGD